MNGINIGDIIERPKGFGLTRHRGVLLGVDQVLHNTPERGEHLSTLAEFAQKQVVSLYARCKDVHAALSRTEKILSDPRKYHLIVRNCDHTVNDVVFGKPSSPQLVLAAVGSAAVLSVFALFIFFRGKR